MLRRTQFFLCLLSIALSAGQSLQGFQTPESQDVLAEAGIQVSQGAAPGFVPDRVCEACHSEIYETYQTMGMARSFFKPRADRIIEDFNKLPYFHEASKRYYEMSWSGSLLTFKRYEKDSAGRPIHIFEQQVDWILGSGNKSRTYLYQTKSGELFQLPVSWYTETSSWGMAPGFDQSQHMGVQRRVPRECMYCHNAYPEVPAGSDLFRYPAVFPAQLPEGIGCQRCHGPGAEHLRAALSDGIPNEQLQTSIVNPARLHPESRNEVCEACHLQPSVALFGVRRFGRGVYSQRPGEPFSEYLVQMEVEERDTPQSERFEINHHAYRLRQSRCYKSSQGQLFCVNCHDPHNKITASQDPAHFRRACLNCHSDESKLAAAHGSVSGGSTVLSGSDCVGCHMPQRRPSDVVQVVMRDHLITRPPVSAEAIAPLQESTPQVIGVELLDPSVELSKLEQDVYRLMALLTAGIGGRTSLNALYQRLLGPRSSTYEPWLQLGRGLMLDNRASNAEVIFSQILETHPDLTIAREFLSITTARQGRISEAIERMRPVLEKWPDRPEAHFNMALYLIQLDQQEKALEHLRKAVDLRPTLSQAWFYLGLISRTQGELETAIENYQKALSVNPIDVRTYSQLAETLLLADQPSESVRYLRQALRKYPESVEIQQLLEKAQNTP